MSAAARLALVGEATLPDASGRRGRDHIIAVGLVGVSAAYATLRYNVLKGVPWSDWPGYVADKVLAVAGLLLLGLAGWRKVRGSGPGAVLMGWGGALVLGHVLLSLGLLPAGYFERFIASGRVTVAGGISLLAGALALALLELGARLARSWTAVTAARALAMLLALGALHTAAPGLGGWLTPGSWPGGLPPLTMLASLPALVVAGLLAARGAPVRQR